MFRLYMSSRSNIFPYMDTLVVEICLSKAMTSLTGLQRMVDKGWVGWSPLLRRLKKNGSNPTIKDLKVHLIHYVIYDETQTEGKESYKIPK